MRIRGFVFRWALAACLLASLGNAALADTMTRNLVVVPFNVSPAVEAVVSTDRPGAAIGSTIQICFRVSQPGFVTLWDIGSDGSVGRIFPNAYSGDAADAKKVSDPAEQCAGRQNDAFRFQVAGPAGIEDVYLVWTVTPDLQPGAATFASQAEFAAALGKLDAAPRDRWVAVKTSFDVLAQTGDAAVPDKPHGRTASDSGPTDRGDASSGTAAVTDIGTHVFVFAAGADVRPLTKTGQDARTIAASFQTAFGIPGGNLRVTENATKTQFKAGIDWLAGAAKSNDTVVVFFSGSGVQLRERTAASAVAVEQALVPYDVKADTGNQDDYLASHELIGWLNGIPTDKVILILDASYSWHNVPGVALGVKPKFFVPSSKMLEEEEAASHATRGLTVLMGAPSHQPFKGVVFSAAKADQAAVETETGGRYSNAITAALGSAKSLRQDSKTTLMTVFDAARQSVEQFSNQEQSPIVGGDTHIADAVTLP